MNGNYEYDESDEYEAEYSSSAFETDESDESDEGESYWGESRRRGRGQSRPVRTAPRNSVFTPRPKGPGEPVTQAQLALAIAGVTRGVGLNSKAIATVDGRVRGVQSDQHSMKMAVKKELAASKKSLDKVRNDLKTTQMISAVLPFLAPSSSTATGFLKFAPILHLVGPDLLSGVNQGGSGGASGLGGNTTFITAAALLVASGAFK